MRLDALREVGGVATETLTEDIHTTIRLHRRGWHTVYHNEVVAHGLAAQDSDQYQTQRLRWGTGAMQLLHLEHPITGPGLRFRQRVAYASTIMAWFDSWRSLGYVLLPVAVVFSGASPIYANVKTFVLFFGVTFVLQRFALAMLARGYAPIGMAMVFEFVRMQSTAMATLSYLGWGERTFKVTAKGGESSRRRQRAPRLLWFLEGLSGAAVAWFLAVVTGVVHFTYTVPWSVYFAMVWLFFNALLISAAIERIRSSRFASDRRSSVRLHASGRAQLDGHDAEVIDISIGGALVRVSEDGFSTTTGTTSALTLAFDHDAVTLQSVVRNVHEVPDQGTLVSLQFASGQNRAIGQMSVGLFGAQS